VCRSYCSSWLIPATCIVLLAGCSPVRESRNSNNDGIGKTSGLWDASFRLSHAPLQDSLGLSAEQREAVRGSVALIATEGNPSNSLLPAHITHAGVYDIRFDRFGFTTQRPGAVQSLVAAAVSPDSLYVVLPADGGDGWLTARGIRRGDSVSGDWQYGSRAAGGWAGTFTLTRRPDTTAR